MWPHEYVLPQLKTYAQPTQIEALFVVRQLSDIDMTLTHVIIFNYFHFLNLLSVDVVSMYEFHSSILMKMTTQKYRKIKLLQRNWKGQWTNDTQTQYIIKLRKPQSNHDIDSKFMKKTHHRKPKFNLQSKITQTQLKQKSKDSIFSFKFHHVMWINHS